MNKTILAMALMAGVFISGCSKDDDDEIIQNPLIGTSWTAPDPIAEMIYGGTCTTTIEFLDETECQEIEKRENSSVGSGTFAEKGTYEIYGDSVKWIIDDSTMKGEISGSIISTTMRNMDGGNIVYTKN